MLSFEPLIKPLSHEWHLGNQLSESVHGGEPDQFRLLLSLLSEDVQDQPQFEKLSQESAAEKKLRAWFELGEPQNFYAQPEELEGGEGAKLANAADRMALLLKNCLHPEPLTAPQVTGPGYEIMSTLSPLQQYKQRLKVEPELAAQPELNWNLADQALLNMLNQQRQVA